MQETDGGEEEKRREEGEREEESVDVRKKKAAFSSLKLSHSRKKVESVFTAGSNDCAADTGV